MLLNSQTNSHSPHPRSSVPTFLQQLYMSWQFLWPQEQGILDYYIYLCFLFSLAQRVFNALQPQALTLRISLYFLCEFINLVCGEIVRQLWREVKRWSGRRISEELVAAALDSPERIEHFQSGAFLSEVNKSGSLIVCLGEILFTWLPFIIDVLWVVYSTWKSLGKILCIVILIIVVICFGYSFFMARFLESRNRAVIHNKRERDTAL